MLKAVARNPIPDLLVTAKTVNKEAAGIVEEYLKIDKLIGDRMIASGGYYGSEFDPETFQNYGELMERLKLLGTQHKVVIKSFRDFEIKNLLTAIINYGMHGLNKGMQGIKVTIPAAKDQAIAAGS